MASQSLPINSTILIRHIIEQMKKSCELIMTWNDKISDANQYTVSPTGLEKMAASCMLIEAIGEGVKKIDRLAPDFLLTNCPETQWKQIMGLRDHIAHGYFNLDAEIIFDVVKNNIPTLKEDLGVLLKILEE